MRTQILRSLVNRLGNKAAKWAACLLATVYVGSVWGAETTTIKNAAGDEDITVYEVSSGFYQSAATYGASTDFYITSKVGLEYFRDLVNAKITVVDAYVNDFCPKSTVTQFYQLGIFGSKTVHLLSDIDLQNADWMPIGYAHKAATDDYYGNDKEVFYGHFNGHGHKISNLKVETFSNNSKFEYGLFGRIGAPANQTFSNLIIENVKIAGGSGAYVGALVGSGQSNLVAYNNCKVIGNIELSSSKYIGGICGIGACVVVNCEVSGQAGSAIVGGTFSGGLVGAMRLGNALEVVGNTVNGVAISATSSGRAGSLVGAMALDVAGACSVIGNEIVDCTVNGADAELGTLFGPSTATTVMTYENNIVRTTLIVETGDLTPNAEVAETKNKTAINLALGSSL